MRTNFVLSSLLFLLAISSVHLAAQSRSEEKIKMGTLSYYIHTIQKNETIGGLAQVYRVTSRQIEEANPNIQDIQKIKAGQKLLIPNFSEFETQYPVSEWDFILYKVKVDDKLKGIAKTYRTEVKDIKNVNSGIENKPRPSSVILVPMRKNVANQVSAGAATGKPTASQEVNDPKKRGEVKNPAVGFDWGNGKRTVEEKSSDNERKSDDCKSYRYDARKDVFNLSLLLPLYLDSDKRDNSGLFFLEGALLAIEELKRGGLSLNVNIVDVGTKEAMTKALASKELDKADLIVGPFALSELKTLAAYAQKKEIPMVAPYEPGAYQLAETNPYVFQIYPNDESIYKKLTGEKFDDEINPILVLPTTVDSVMLVSYRKALKDKFGTYKEYTHEMGMRIKDDSPLTGVMSKQKRNLLFVCSNREAFVSDLMDRLQVVKLNGYPVCVYGRVQWLNFRIIDVARYYDLNLHLVQPFHVDYANEEVKQFIKVYRLSYNNEPTQYAFQGYDVTYYFLQAMKKYGPQFASCLPDFPSKLLQSRYRFKRVGEKGGYINTDSFMLEYTPELDVVRD